MPVEDHDEAMRLLTECVDLCLALGLTCNEVDQGILPIIRGQPPLDRFPRPVEVPGLGLGLAMTLQVIAHRYGTSVPA